MHHFNGNSHVDCRIVLCRCVEFRNNLCHRVEFRDLRPFVSLNTLDKTSLGERNFKCLEQSCMSNITDSKKLWCFQKVDKYTKQKITPQSTPQDINSFLCAKIVFLALLPHIFLGISLFVLNNKRHLLLQLCLISYWEINKRLAINNSSFRTSAIWSLESASSKGFFLFVAEVKMFKLAVVLVIFLLMHITGKHKSWLEWNSTNLDWVCLAYIFYIGQVLPWLVQPTAGNE